MKDNKIDYLKKRNRGGTKNQGMKKDGKNFSVKYNKDEAPANEEFENMNEEIQFIPDNEDKKIMNEELVKIGKFWEGKNLIEPKNTTGKFAFNLKDKTLLSQVENSIHILDIENLSTIKIIKQVRRYNINIRMMKI